MGIQTKISACLSFLTKRACRHYDRANGKPAERHKKRQARRGKARGKAGAGMPKPKACLAENTRVLAAEYSSTLRKVRRRTTEADGVRPAVRNGRRALPSALFRMAMPRLSSSCHTLPRCSSTARVLPGTSVNHAVPPGKSPRACNGLHHHTPVQGDDAPLCRSGLESAITAHGLPDASGRREARQPSRRPSAPISSRPGKAGRRDTLSRHFPALAPHPACSSADARPHAGRLRQTNGHTRLRNRYGPPTPFARPASAR